MPVILAQQSGFSLHYRYTTIGIASNIGAESNYYDIPIGQAFIRQWNNWKTGPTKRYHEIADRVQKDIAKIFEYQTLEINASPEGQRLHMLINGKNYKISELGSGLTQFFLVLASAAMRSPSPSFILIDEPETNLHPSLQLDFLTRLTSYAGQGILFATHSIGLARASADHIYSVRRGTDDLSEITDCAFTNGWFPNDHIRSRSTVRRGQAYFRSCLRLDR